MAPRISISVLTEKKRIEAIVGNSVAHDEALRFQLFVGELILDACEAFSRGAVVRQLEDASEKDRNVVEPGSGTLLDFGNDQVTEIGVRAAEVEMKLDLLHDCHHLSPNGRISCSKVQASRGCW
jgi:hypothetical protein